MTPTEDRFREIERVARAADRTASLAHQRADDHENDIRAFAPAIQDVHNNAVLMGKLEQRVDGLVGQLKQERRDRERNEAAAKAALEEVKATCAQERREQKEAEQAFRLELSRKGTALKVAAIGFSGVALTAAVTLIAVLTGQGPTP